MLDLFLTSMPLHLLMFTLLLCLPLLRAKEYLDFAATLQIQPRAHEDEGELEDNVDPEEAEVAPVVVVVYAEASGLSSHC